MNIPKETEFELIKETVRQKILSDYGKQRFTEQQPATSLQSAQKRLSETQEAMALLDSGQQVPFMGLAEILHHTTKIEKGLILEPRELIDYGDFLRSFRLIRQMFEKNQWQTPRLTGYAQGLVDFSEIAQQIFDKIRNGQVDTDASRELRKIRGQIAKHEADLKKVFSKFLQEPRLLQDARIIQKNERYTLPVRSEFQHQIKGQIIERSNKRSTVFIEPEAAVRLNDRLMMAKAEETAEEYQILASLTGLIAENLAEIFNCLDILVELDIIFARAKYCREIHGVPLTINEEERIDLRAVRHPLLGQDAVPLTLELGSDARCLVITGPNAGGKTVVLKTVALISVMAHYGLFPAHAGGSQIPFLKNLWMDIGDQQSLSNALSTFSGHMNNVAQILKYASRQSIVLLDEIGSGTEPNEGAALAIAIMEAIYQSGALLIATTHYGEIKQFAIDHQDFHTAAMAFDPETLMPKYRLLSDAVGTSNAFWIAEKMTIAKEVVAKAQQYLETKEYPKQKMAFKAIHKKPQTTETATHFQKGDRISYTETNQIGLFYDYLDNGQAQVLLDETLVTVPARRLKLLMARENLYPKGYDLESLFHSFAERKFQRDIDRGSKKAQKELRKQAEKRQSENG
jgi:DNA mismatch repair protein MutS2